MCLCGTYVQYSYFVSPGRYQYRLQLSTDSKFCMQLGTPILMPTTRTPYIGRLYFIYQSIGQIISFQMMPPLRSFDDLDGKERGQKKTDDLKAMTTLGPRTLQYPDLPFIERRFSFAHFSLSFAHFDCFICARFCISFAHPFHTSLEIS